MTPATLALTILFVAEDPSAPVVAVELVEAEGRRSAVVVLIGDTGPGDAAAQVVALTDSDGRAPRALSGLPLPPTGASLTPAVDGVVVTIEDVGSDWLPLFAAPAPPPSTPKNKASAKPKPSPWPWPPPDIAVADARTLRLFVPAVVDGASTPASVHGVGLRAQGAAVTFTRPITTAVAATLAGVDIDATPPTLVTTPSTSTTSTTLCAPPAHTVQRFTQSTLTTARCLGSPHAGLVVARVTGTRFGDVAARDRPATGIIAWRGP